MRSHHTSAPRSHAHNGLDDPPPRTGTSDPIPWAPPRRLAPTRAPPPEPQRLLRLLRHPPRPRPGQHAPADRARPSMPRRVGPDGPGPSCCRPRRCSEGSGASCDDVHHLSGGMDLQQGRTGPAVSPECSNARGASGADSGFAGGRTFMRSNFCWRCALNTAFTLSFLPCARSRPCHAA